MTMLADDKQLTLEPAASQRLSSELQEPRWAHEVRRSALQLFEQLPYPKGTDEHWRRTDPERFRPEGRAMLTVAPRFDTLGEGQVENLLHLDLNDALHQDEATLRPFLQETVSEKFAALNGAWRTGGAFVSVPAGRTVETPVRAIHEVKLPDGPAAFVPRSIVVAQENSNATVVEHFESADGDLLAVPVVQIRVKQGAKLQYVMVCRWGQGTRAVARFQAHVEKDAQLRVLVLGIGGSITKTFMVGDLEGEGSKSEMLGLVFANGRQHFDIDSLHNHLVANTGSDVLFNVALNDRARSVFGGNIYVAPGAQKTDAYQKNRNLILSDKARADSMPKLEIVANDVRCTHGATFTTYDADQRFYLQSRGLKDADARRLIITGFFQEVIERLEGPVLVEWLAGLMQEKMETALGLPQEA